jgi:thioredoxin
MIEHLTKEAFLKVFNYEKNQEWKFEGELPCLIDFYADWCGPCKMVAPVLEELAKEYDGKINIYKVDTEQEQELAAAFGIRSIPACCSARWANRLRWQWVHCPSKASYRF